jgi:murein DD-endopeptidase MepM/ murein hydrolase activator NlpD
VKPAFFVFVIASGCAASEAEAPRGSVIRDLTATATARDCGAMEWPVDGPLSSGFGRRDGRAHDGIDLAVAEGTPVRAACDGTVAYAGDRLRGYGRLVIVAHAPGLATVYAHNSRLLVREGDAVRRGGVIALSGQTGHATAPHVHFEVRKDDRPRDPLKYLRPRAVAEGDAWTTASLP